MNEEYFDQYFETTNLWKKVEELNYGKITIEIKRGIPFRIVEEKGVLLDE